MKSQASNVIDLEAFRQKKQRERAPMPMTIAPMFVPVWICWVPVWTPLVP
jgi:hypothetical protein